MPELLEILNDLIFDYTLRTVALGAMTLGIVSGALGSYAFLRKQSLMGDAISHAALPGVVLAFMLFNNKSPLILFLGAVVVSWLGTILINSITRYTRIKEDSAMGFILSVFFGFGLMLLTFVQRQPKANQAGLDTFLFGQAAALVERDVITMAVIGSISLLLVILFWKEFKLLSFDPEFGASLGFNMQFLNIVLTTLLVIAIVIGLQAVGVVLMSAMVVAPAASARQWTNKMNVMIILSSFFGAIAGVSGAVISSLVPGLSTGPTIVLSMSAIVLFSMLFAPNRGILWRWIQQLRNRRILNLEAVLLDLYSLAAKHGDHERSHSAELLKTMRSGEGGVNRSLNELSKRGWVSKVGKDEWKLTSKGWKEAELAFNQLGGTK